MNSYAILIIIILIILFIIHKTSPLKEPASFNSGTYIKLLSNNQDKCISYNFLLQLDKQKKLTGFIKDLEKSTNAKEIELYNRIKTDADSIQKKLPNQNGCNKLIIASPVANIDNIINNLNSNSKNMQLVDSILDGLDEEDLEELVIKINDSKNKGKPLIRDNTLHVYINDYCKYILIKNSLEQKSIDIDSVLNDLIINLSNGSYSKNVLVKFTDYLIEDYNNNKNNKSKEIYDKLKIMYNSMSNKPFNFNFINL